ncbi:MAG: ABC transporter ATP-binding protein [Lachnospiraceae bacterium]|nr:ABC transporter ATP-binding protein [Lachnospiraceae bacterium]
MDKIKQRNAGIIKNACFLVKESLRFDKRILAFIIITVITGTMIPVLGIYMPKAALDLLVNKAQTARILSSLGIMTAGLLFLQGMNGYLSSRAYYHHNELRNSYFIQRLFYVSIKCSYSHVEDAKFEDVYRRAINSVRSGDESGTTVFFEEIPKLITHVLCFFLYSGLLMQLNVYIVILLLISSIIIYLFRRRENICYERTRNEYAHAEKRLYYTIGECGSKTAGKDIRIYNMKNWLVKQILRFQTDEGNILKLRRRKEYETHLVSCLLGYLRDGFAYIYLIVHTVDGQLGMGDFMLYFGAITGFSVWITDIVTQIGRIKTANIKMNDLRTFLDIPSEDMETSECGAPDVSGGVDIQFEHVSFSYPGSEKRIISDLSFHIKRGEHVALVGLNGAGKTTLLKLMMGMYEPTDGVIKINGEDIRKFRKKDIYALYSAVFQDTMVLPARIDENIALMPDYDIDNARIEKALRLSGLYEEFNERNIGTDRYMTRQLTEDGILLSGGQEQKFLLARALYKDAPVLLLDEPTAALDPLAEQEVYEKYESLCRYKTAVFISHRLASTQFSDWIMFLQDGHIAEQGNHEELLAAGGEYARLYELQSHYYKAENGNPEDGDICMDNCGAGSMEVV